MAMCSYMGFNGIAVLLSSGPNFLAESCIRSSNINSGDFSNYVVPGAGVIHQVF